MKMQMLTKSSVYSMVWVSMKLVYLNIQNSFSKIIYFSIVIFIGGVAFSISHAIIPTEEAENIKHLAEVKTSKKKLFLNKTSFLIDLFYISLLGINMLDNILYNRYCSSST
jgi:hypothetical protein